VEYKFNAPTLVKASLLPLPQRIIEKIKAALEEDESYVADELVELAEEVLSHIAAFGIRHYILKAPQKEVYNDFLIQLFNSSGHDYNAGPIYRWAANMIKECPILKESGLFQFYWEMDKGVEMLSPQVHHLAELRNKVMHGFFVLPPEENYKEAEQIGQILIDLHESNFFKTESDFHFLNKTGFTGKWNIADENEWGNYIGNTLFGQLCQRIVLEQSNQFLEEEAKVFENANAAIVPDNLKSFIQNNERGAFALWVHPEDKEQINYYSAIGNWLSKQDDIYFVGYGLHERGISFTGSFLIQKLLKCLETSETKSSKNKKPIEQLPSIRKKLSGKVVVLINDIQIALFSPQHVMKLYDYLFANNILLIAVGHHYEHFDSFFNGTLVIDYKYKVPVAKKFKSILHNYLRFKGPFYDRQNDKKDIMMLEEILSKVIEELKATKKVYARRFADQYNYNIEYVHEIFSLLHPWVMLTRENFQEDTIDELYGFPTTLTEVTPIYLALGRRDLKLEYQHKVISI
jgi:hypothetical protein